jgi:hypothetical protein
VSVRVRIVATVGAPSALRGVGVPDEKFEKETTADSVAEDVAHFLRGCTLATLFAQGGGVSILVHPIEPVHGEGRA